MRFAYADPPYPGQSAKHYRNHPDFAGEVDHDVLIGHLISGFPDGWALSTKTTSLRDLLPLCPPQTRVMAWTKPFCAFKKGVNPAYAWEPVLVFGGRRRLATEHYRRDWLAAMPPAFVGQSNGVPGTKPLAFSFWIFDVLNAVPGDELVDMFPGSGAVARAWRSWSALEPVDIHEQAAMAL